MWFTVKYQLFHQYFTCIYCIWCNGIIPVTAQEQRSLFFHSMFEAMFEYGGVKVILKKIYAQNTCIQTLTERNSL